MLQSTSQAVCCVRRNMFSNNSEDQMAAAKLEDQIFGGTCTLWSEVSGLAPSSSFQRIHDRFINLATGSVPNAYNFPTTLMLRGS
jgi:hypothetical protein